MKIKSHVLLLTLFALPWAAGPATAAVDAIPLEAVEITATRSALNGDETPASVTVITEEEIKEKQHRTVEELLRGEFGLDVVSQGPTGALTNVFLRGSNSSSTLVMIDGVQVNLNTAGGFNFADLTTDNIEKIEILRGPQSTLWGADAVGGVINIVTKQGQGRPTHAVSFEGGSFATFRETASSSGAIDAFDYSLSVSRTDSDGFSAANENDGNTEEDGYGNTTVSTRLGHALGAESRAELNARYSHANFDFDSFGPIDGPGFSRTDSFYISAPLSTTFAGFWNVRLTPSLAYDNSEFIDPTFTSDVTNRTYTIDLQNSLKFSPAFSLILGGEYQALNGEVKDAFDDTRDNQGFYAQSVVTPIERIVLTAGLRHDINSDFEDKTTYKLEGAYKLKETGTRLRAVYATGFRTPTLNDTSFSALFGCTVSNLQPEDVDSWEAGFDQTLFDERVKLSATYFDADHEELIQLDSFFCPQNVAKAQSRGVETGLDIQATDNLDLHLKYTWNKTEDEATGLPLLRRAENKFSATLVHHWREKLNTLVGVVGRGETRDSFNDIPGYVTLRTAISYRYSDNLTLTVRGENLLDQEYEEVTGFGTAGVSAFAGFVYRFN